MKSRKELYDSVVQQLKQKLMKGEITQEQAAFIENTAWLNLGNLQLPVSLNAEEDYRQLVNDRDLAAFYIRQKRQVDQGRITQLRW